MLPNNNLKSTPVCRGIFMSIEEQLSDIQKLHQFLLSTAHKVPKIFFDHGIETLCLSIRLWVIN